MAVAVEEFVKGLEVNGLISPGELQAVRDALPSHCRQDAQELGRALFKHKALTMYQVRECYAGKARDLILGNYTILDKIGQGGMGQVFKAHHRRMDRIVAIKILPARVTNEHERAARFEREAKAAAKLNHPNIVTAFDADQANGLHFLVMEFVEGCDLKAWVTKNGPLTLDQALSCVVQAARGLKYAHSRGVIHRDIKPANLLLDREGTVKILDMGIARLLSAGDISESDLTGTGQIIGTIDYMAPEQALNTKYADQRADIYSLGATLWYLLTGRAAYDGDTVTEKIVAHREQPIPSLQKACAGVTPALEAVFVKMLAKKPEGRYQTMSEVLAELEPCWSGETTPPAIGDAHLEDDRLDELLRGTTTSGATRIVPSGRPAAANQVPPQVLETTSEGSISGSVSATSPTIPIATPASSRVAGPFQTGSGRHRAALFLTGAAGIAAIFWAGIALFQQTNHGTLWIEIGDPKIEALVDGQGATIQGARPDEIRLQPGLHFLRIKYGELDFETNKFNLNRADSVTIAVQLLPGKVQVVQGDTVLGERPLPPPPFAIAPFDANQARAHQEAWAQHLGTEVEISSPLGIRQRLIPPGEFLMGSPQAEVDALVKSTTDRNWQAHFRSEAPQHRVQLTKAFYLGTYPVTQRQYQEVMGFNPSQFSLTGSGKDTVRDSDPDQHPVESVCWRDAVNFCNMLSEKEGLNPYYLRIGDDVAVVGGTGYRLPTEAERECACRAGTTTRWSFGDNETNLPRHAWTNMSANERTHPVGELAANPYGLYDLHGNVWEWCWDWHGDYSAAAAVNPTGPSTGTVRVLRGGAFNFSPAYSRSALRDRFEPWLHAYYFGFRVARTYRK
jgi:serine/threonine protein kinase/formylglycine-generating enzyme required for sulfatase activity